MIKRNKNGLRLSVIGTAGVPSSYGGFETLAENLCKYHDDKQLPIALKIYCSEKHYKNKKSQTYLSAELRYINLNANGIASIVYDSFSIIDALRTGTDVILALGVSGALSFPILRLFSRKKLIVNIDGIEWKREKWGWPARFFLKISEQIATKYAHVVICDNEAITNYVRSTYGVIAKTIAYGGDHSLSSGLKPFEAFVLPEHFAFSVCRIEPENNIHLILEAFSKRPNFAIIFVGNWNYSEYSRNLRDQYSKFRNLHLLDPIYDSAILATLRSKCTIYVHGHSAGGTNPSLVEAMFFGRPIVAFDCPYNRVTTDNAAIYFRDVPSLLDLITISDLNFVKLNVGAKLKQLALERYMWKDIAKEYYDTITDVYFDSQ